MASTSAAFLMDDDDFGPPYGDPSAPVEVEPEVRQRFRPVPRRGVMATAREAASGSVHFTLAAAAIPAVCLLVYVIFWTLAMRGGYYRAQLQTQLRHEQVVRAELEAQLNQKRAPVLIAKRASDIGMLPAGKRVFAGSGKASLNSGR